MSEKLHDPNTTINRDALLELEILRQQERQHRIQNEYVIKALSQLIEKDDPKDAIESILEMISEIFLSDSVGILVMKNEELGETFSTNDSAVWSEDTQAILVRFMEKSERVISELSEYEWWQAAPEKLKVLGESVMLLTLTIKNSKYVAYCFHTTPSAYNYRDVKVFEKLIKALLQAIRQLQSREKREKLEKDLRQAQKLEALGTLASGVAHEINTPIQYIGDNLKFINETLSELMATFDKALETGNLTAFKEELAFFKEEVPAAANDAMSGTTQVARIVSSMKSFTHPCNGQKVLTDLNEALQASITISRNVWKHHVKIVTDFDEKLPKIEAIRDELNQVWLNMIVNGAQAVEQSPAGTGTVTIRTRTDDERTVSVEIEDTGIGIKPEHIERIFEPFFTTKGVGKGTGQGLAIAFEIVNGKHNGSINVTSEHGKGTKFTVTLPIKAEEPDLIGGSIGSFDA